MLPLYTVWTKIGGSTLCELFTKNSTHAAEGYAVLGDKYCMYCIVLRAAEITCVKPDTGKNLKIIKVCLES
jgi:hypothetical protein